MGNDSESPNELWTEMLGAFGRDHRLCKLCSCPCGKATWGACSLFQGLWELLNSLVCSKIPSHKKLWRSSHKIGSIWFWLR